MNLIVTLIIVKAQKRKEKKKGICFEDLGVSTNRKG